MTFRTFFGAAALLLSSSCVDSATTAEEARAASNAYLVKDMGVKLADWKIESTIDMGDRWRLLYKLEPGSTGGPIIVVVNKRSGKVVHVETEQ